jgi:hypothetical protein
MVAGAGLEPAHRRLMRPLPYLLATPQLEMKSGTASRCCPELVRFWRPNCAGWRPPRCRLGKVVRSAGIAPASPDWHSGILLLNDEREKMSGAGGNWCAPAPHTTKKEQTPLSVPVRNSHPLDSFHGGCFGVSGTPPVRDMDCLAKPLVWKIHKLSISREVLAVATVRGEKGNQTIQTC